MPRLSDYMTIGEAAEFLGVSQNTLRNWGRAAKIKDRRNPVNGYRLYSATELKLLLEKAEHPETKAKKSKPKKPR